MTRIPTLIKLTVGIVLAMLLFRIGTVLVFGPLLDPRQRAVPASMLAAAAALTGSSALNRT